MAVNHTRILLFFLFVASGFTGLIYESIWSHYLKLFLGHAAYAQALVLAIFMGGMAIGSWFSARHLSRWSNLLLIYAAIEGVIGLFGIGFHQTFTHFLALSFDSIIPSLGSPAAVHLYKWSTGALLILPQSILLGMTFPLMSNGLMRLLPGSQGTTLSMLYFCNSIGAAIGVLVSGFYLIEVVGLPGTILTAGLINIGLAIVIYEVAKNKPATEIIQSVNSKSNFPRLFLVAAFITGVASFIYELSWIRMLSMVLGASTHSFELMLSAFITGLAFGGLWIYRHIDNLKSPIQTGGYIQILMGVFALATIPLYNLTFDLMGFFMQALNKTESGYQLFTFSSHIIALFVMLPTTFCAGMTLPLFTFILLKQGYGEKSVGYTYASNTLGAIVGVAFTIYIGLPVLGMKNSILLGASLDIILGVCLIFFFSPKPKLKIYAIPAIIVITPLLIILILSDFDTRRMAAGVYRTKVTTLSDDSQIIFHKDGKTASISVMKDSNNLITISTNGKPDASIDMNAVHPANIDEITQTLLALIPLSIHPDIQSAAIIGMGSGLTAHSLLSDANIKKVDTIEIESAVVEGANLFRPKNERVYSDKRSNIYIEDAKTFFSTHNKKYDLIISEPSNPWVSGVSGLFSKEFYERMTHHLRDKGLLVQWIHLYEIDTPLVFSVLKALTSHFPNFALYFTDNTNFLIVARQTSKINQPRKDIFSNPDVMAELKLIHLNGIDDINARFIANNEILLPLINSYKVATNSDYFPFLDLNAPRTRFLKQHALDFINFKHTNLPIINLLLPGRDSFDTRNISTGNHFLFNDKIKNAQKFIQYIEDRPDIATDLLVPEIINLELLKRLANTCEAHMYSEMWIDNFYTLTIKTLPYLQAEQLLVILNAITPDCEYYLSKQQTTWIALYKAFIDSNANEIVKSSSFLLNNFNDLSISKKRFLFSASILAMVVTNDPNIKPFWNEYIMALYANEPIPLWLTMLTALSQHSNK